MLPEVDVSFSGSSSIPIIEEGEWERGLLLRRLVALAFASASRSSYIWDIGKKEVSSSVIIYEF